MKYLIGILTIAFTLLFPVITIAGLLTKVGVSGPEAMFVGFCLMTGVVFVVVVNRRKP